MRREIGAQSAQRGRIAEIWEIRAESSGEIGSGHKKSQPDRLPLRLAALPRLTIITHTLAHVHAKKPAKLQLFFDMTKFLSNFFIKKCNFIVFTRKIRNNSLRKKLRQGRLSADKNTVEIP